MIQKQYEAIAACNNRFKHHGKFISMQNPSSGTFQLILNLITVNCTFLLFTFI